MLKGLDPRLTPELLFVLAAMGHGDEIVVVDANFPAESVGRSTVHRRPLRLGCDALEALEVILTLLPVDGFEPGAVARMQVVGDPAAVPDIVAEAAPILAAAGVDEAPEALERFAFYERARGAYAIVLTNELRLYGNFALRKGVVRLRG